MIVARHLSKLYRIYDRPRDRLKQMLWRGRRSFGREFWALHDVSFEIGRGESVGVIGRNGSGKSTLLQIIAGILTPTSGQVEVEGRVAALLELGSGFNPEFSGRENVFINGSILGMSRRAMEERFDTIAAFAEIGGYLDQPVKHYSSGMLLRLAFAVQAHLDADILIVDEALAVGDASFQHKCMRRIKQLVDQGTTLLFVSHSTEIVKRFCRHGIWLDAGECRYQGPAGVAVEKYLAFLRMRDAQLNTAPSPFGELAGEAPQAPDEPTAAPAQALPLLTGDIDLADERLFLRGVWSWAPEAASALPARIGSGAQARAAFRCTGGSLELRFMRGPSAPQATIIVDGVAQQLDLFDHEPQIARIQLELPEGEHSVLLGPAGQAEQPPLYWLGGRLHTSPRLRFLRDPALGTISAEVERYGNGKGRLTAVELLDYLSMRPVSELSVGQRVRLRLHAERCQTAGPRLELSYIIRDRNRVDLFGTTTFAQQIRLDSRAERFVVEFTFEIRLGPGSYSILASFVEASEDLSQMVPMDQIDIAAVFSVGFDPQRPVWYIFDEPVAVSAALNPQEQEHAQDNQQQL